MRQHTAFVISARRAATQETGGARQHWLTGGIAYGVPVYLVMNFVVLPLSAWHRMPHVTLYGLIANLLAMMLFGVIVSYFASRLRDAA